VRILALLLLASTINMNQTESNLDSISEKYVRLVLSVGVHDSDYVDAYYGFPKVREEVQKQKLSYQQIQTEANDALAQIDRVKVPSIEIEKLRREYLKKQLQSLVAFVQIRMGKKLTFDEESKALYDAVSPHFSGDHFANLLEELNTELPGKGDLSDRYEVYMKDFVIPKEKLDTVFQVALKECRKRTLKYISLPPDESFTVEYVKNKPWGGYNWYQGNFRSVIQVNSDLPIYVDRAVDLAGHEGYPGHHVYNVLLEQELRRKRNWNEFSVYPLFSPQSLIAEGSANYGVEVLFPGEERVKFEETVIFPAAGLDPSKASQFFKIQKTVSKLSYAGNEAARHFLDHEWNEEQSVKWLQKYSLYSRDRAMKRLDFIKKYRSYVINYNLGRDLVAKYIESHAKSDQERWSELAKMLGSPILPGTL
jgi:hypothetical protein